MSILDTFFTVKKDESEAAKPVRPIKASPKPIQEVEFKESGIPTYDPDNTHTVDTGEFTDHFDKLFKDSNLPGPDYYEFIGAKDNLSSAIPDEASRYKAALAVLLSQGLSKSIIISTADKYKAIINKEVFDFNKAFEVQYAQSVSSTKEVISTKQREMSDLTAKINALNAEITGLQDKANTAGQALNSKKQLFDVASKQALSKIDNEVNKINQYIN